MVDQVIVPPEEQIALRDSPEDVPFVRDAPVEAGYGEGDQNSFYAERQAFIWSESGDDRGKDGYAAALDALEVSMDVMERSLAHQELALSSSKVANEERRQAINISAGSAATDGSLAILMESINAAEQIDRAAQAEPTTAASVASTQLLNPSLDEATRNAVGFRDTQLGTISKRLDDRRVVSLGTSNWVADAASILLVPARTLWGQGQFPGTYVSRMLAWDRLSVAERHAQWPELEQDLWDASGNNAIVYASLVMPFVDRTERVWAFVEGGLDALALMALVYNPVKAVGAVARLRGRSKFRSFAKAAGNNKAAGADTARGITKGEHAAILEGHPVGVPDAADTIPEVQAGLEVPTTSHLVNDLVDRGIVPDAPTDIPVEHIPMLNASQKAAAVERATRQIGAAGNITRVEETAGGFDVVIQSPAVESITVADARKQLALLGEDLETARASLKDLVDNTGVGEATGEIAALNNQIDAIKTRRAVLIKAVENAKTLEGSGLRVTSIKVPGSEAIEEKINFNWTIDDTGLIEFTEDQVSTIGATKLLSQEFRADNVIEGITGLGSFISNQQRRLYGHLAQEIRQIEKNMQALPLLPAIRSKRKVSAVLLKGDQEGTVFSDIHLSQGVETPEMGLVRLNDREIEAYRAMRRAYDDLYRMLDEVQRTDLTTAGFSGIRVNHVGQDGVVRPITQFVKARHEDISSAFPSVNDTRITHAVDGRTGNVVDLRTITSLSDDLAQSRRGFVEFKTPFINGDGQQYKYALVDVRMVGNLKKARNVFDPPPRTLEYRRGYVPKLIADRIGFVVETVGDVARNGVNVRDILGYRGFKTRTEAELWKQREVLKGSTHEYRIQALDDAAYRRANPEGNDFITQQLFLGAFGGHRTDGAFRIGLEGYEGGRMSAFESIRRYADYVGRHAPMHQFKQGMIARFMNSIKNPDGSRALSVPHDWTSPLLLSKSDPRYKSAKAIQDWMKTVFAVPTNEERKFQGLMQTLGYALDRRIWDKATGKKRFGAGFFEWAQTKLLTSPWAADPFQQAKSLTFDMMLGMFAPAQLVVQSAGMAVPLSLHPVEAAASMPKFLALRNLFRMKNAEDAAEIAVSMGLNKAEFKAMWQGFRRSGFPDSILENADFGHYVSSAHGYYSPGFVQRVREYGRFFYNMGELNTRTLAWTMAHQRLLKANKWSKTANLTSDQLLQINNEALRLSMNMMAANRAAWQDGVLALPTQFMQVTAKYYENLLAGLFNAKKGGKWTRAEAATSLFNNLLLFGAAGFGIDELLDDAETWMVSTDEFGLGLDPEKDADTIAAVRGGLVELFSLNALGFALDISDRVSLGSGITMVRDNIVVPISSWLFEGDASQLASALIGASGTVGTRIHTAASSMWQLFRSDIIPGTVDEVTVGALAMDLARITSTGSNALKAYTWASLNDIINERTGESFGMAPPDQNPGVIYAKALGFDPLALEKFYIIDKKSKEHQRTVKEIAFAVASLYRQLYHDGNVHSPIVRERLQRQQAVLLNQLTEGERALVLKEMDRLWKNNFKIDNLQVDLFDQLMTSDGGGTKEAADITILENLKRNNSSANQD